mmetsp:Transcript_130847/g.419628  ORF Transcript_130847/g.419628 Transcript_130847/m.419628 type:complete len:236 (+) Transcript_130847:3701-4408(+)
MTARMGLSSLQRFSIWVRTCINASRRSPAPSSGPSAASATLACRVASCASNSRRSWPRCCAISHRKDSMAGSCAVSMRSARLPTRCSCPSTLTRIVATVEVISSTWPVSRLSSCSTVRSQARRLSSSSALTPPPTISSPWPSCGIGGTSMPVSGMASRRSRISSNSRSCSLQRSSKARSMSVSSAGFCRRLSAAISDRACLNSSRSSSLPSPTSWVRSRSNATWFSSSRRSCIRS